MPFALGQQGLLGPPHDGERAAQPPVWESEVHINDVSQLSPPGFGQSTGGAQEQAALSPGLVQLTGTREAEPHRHSSPASGEKYSCKSCVKIFKQPQGLARHIREVHDSPPKCPFCPQTWKRAYLMKNHLIKDHGEAFAANVLEGILILQGKDVFVFVETIDFLRTFEPPVPNACQ